MTRYGFIGTGSMGSMLVRQFIQTGLVTPGEITASSKTGASAGALADETGIITVPANRRVAEEADLLFICVKPLEVRGVLQEIRSELDRDSLLVSIAACVSLADLETWGGDKARCVRIIPSVTAEENAGISLVAWGRRVLPEDKTRVLGLLHAIGTAVELEEKDLEVCTNLTSCGPALIAAMMKELGSAAVRTGAIQPELAEYLLRETMDGTARILADKGMTFDTVIERVATPGGSTEEGVRLIASRLPGVMDKVHEVLFAKRRLVTDQVERNG